MNLTDNAVQQMDLRLKTEQLADLSDRLVLTASPVGISRVAYRPSSRLRVAPRTPGRVGTMLDQARREIAEYLAGERTFFIVPVDLSQVPYFERASLEIASLIPYGEVRSYKRIAEQLGNPEAARAVGSAMAGNPVPLIVPCHRVVKTVSGLVVSAGIRPRLPGSSRAPPSSFEPNGTDAPTGHHRGVGLA